jgi:hypothetical protein
MVISSCVTFLPDERIIDGYRGFTCIYHVHHEGEAKRGPNEICSLLSDYITNYVSETVKESLISSDSCPGQNKSRTVVRFPETLDANGRLHKIFQYFRSEDPVTGTLVLL